MNQRLTSTQETGALKRLRASSPSILFVLLILLLHPEPNEGRHLSRRSLYDYRCGGDYQPIFEQYFVNVKAICEDCSALFSDPNIRDLCPKDCFRNEVFQDCIKALMLENKTDYIFRMVNTLAG